MTKRDKQTAPAATERASTKASAVGGRLEPTAPPVPMVGQIVSFEYSPNERTMPRVIGSERVLPAIVVRSIEGDSQSLELRVFQANASPVLHFRGIEHKTKASPGVSNWLWPAERLRLAAGETLEDLQKHPGDYTAAVNAIVDELIERVESLERAVALLIKRPE